MGIEGLEKLIDDDDTPTLETLAQLVRATLKTEDDYHVWKTSGAVATIRTCNVIEEHPEYSHITDSQIGWVVRRVGELIADL